MTKDEALKMAIEALLYGTDHTKAVKACKEALEQPTIQELYDNGGNMTITTQSLTHVIGLDNKGYEAVVKLQSPLYTHPKQWQGLSDDEIEELFPDESKLFSLEDFARAIEAKLKEKNDAN